MSRDGLGDLAARGRREGGWDLRVVFVERQRRWWWNAWFPVTSTELYGFADSKAAAWAAMDAAVGRTRLPDQLDEQRRRHTGGAS